MIRHIIHYGLHFVAPFIIAFVFFRNKNPWQVVIIFLLAMAIDLDHLLTETIYDPNRCSIGFHPLHSYWAIGAYSMLFFFKRTQLVAMALLLHIIADMADCLLM
jgi:dolichol kinase